MRAAFQPPGEWGTSPAAAKTVRNMQLYLISIDKQLPLRRRISSRGRLQTDGWTRGLAECTYMSRYGWSHRPYTYPCTLSLSVQPRASNYAKAPPERPARPQLERAGDLTGRLLKDYLSGWTPQYTEYDYYVPPDAIYGTLPEEIRGTLFLIGPALTEAYGTTVRHPSDADGMVCSLAFGDGGQIFFRNRYVRTSSFIAEQAVGRRLTRGLHDRGAPSLLGNRQQHEEEQRLHNGKDSNTNQQMQNYQHQHQHHQHHQHHHTQQSKRTHRMISDTKNAAAMRTEFDGYAEEEEEEEDGNPRRISPMAAIAAAAVAAAQAVPRHLRFDPFALLGLPNPPPLSALFNPLDLNFRAPANASVVHWAGRLLAFPEGGSLPYELNKLTLETVGQYDVAGTMADIGRLVGGYKIAPAPSPQAPRSSADGGATAGGRRSQRLVLMGAAQSGPDALLRWVEVDEDGRPAGPTTTYRMTGATALGLQDFWVTDQYYVVVQAPLDFNPERFAAEATLGMTSFAECFDWNAGSPSRIHLVRRPSAPAAAVVPSASSSTAAAGIHKDSSLRRSASHNRAIGIGVGGTPIVWPPPGPEAIVVDVPPLLPVSCVGCYSLARQDGRLLVLDAICQQGLSGARGGSLNMLDPEEHRRQHKPELTRLVVDLRTKTVSTRVLSQRTATAATTAVIRAAAGGGGGGAATAAPSSLAPVGHGGSYLGGYSHLYAAASASDAAEGWAPPQVLVKLTLPPEYAVPATGAATAAAVATAAADIRNSSTASTDGLARWRGTGAEVWYPGDRVFVGPPVFIPRALSGTKGRIPGTGGGGGVDDSTIRTGAGTTIAAAVEVSGWGRRPVSASQLPSGGSLVEPAAVGPLDEEQEGWLLVMLHDAEAMTAELCVLDARDVTRGPVAVVHLQHHLPHAHGAHFTESYCGPGLAAPPGWRPRTAAAMPSKDPSGLERTNQ